MSAKIIELAGRSDLRTAARPADSNQRLVGELRRARMRIAQLERSLTVAIQDSLTNYNRAREAERRLEAVRQD